MKNHNFFKDKKCFLCRKEATNYTSFQEHFYYLCDNKECKNKINEKYNIFNGINIKEYGNGRK